jgi:hypothetical protein
MLFTFKDEFFFGVVVCVLSQPLGWNTRLVGPHDGRVVEDDGDRSAETKAVTPGSPAGQPGWGGCKVTALQKGAPSARATCSFVLLLRRLREQL